jgi:hypothetical protein
MIGQSIKDRYEKVSPLLPSSGLSPQIIGEVEWLAGIVLTPNPSIDRNKIIQKCTEFGDSELAATLKTALNDRTLVTSLFQKFEEILSSLEEKIDTDSPPPQPVSTGVLREAHPYKSLWFYNGVRISSLPQLLSSLKDIDDETFKEHVNEYKHDIAEWVSKSLHDDVLSKRLEAGKTKEEIKHIIEHAVHEKIHTTLKESEQLQKGAKAAPPKVEDGIKILDALELPELPGDIRKILGVKEDRNVPVEEKEIARKAEEERVRKEKEEAEKAAQTEGYDHEGLIPIEKKTSDSEDDNFNSFMDLFTESDAKANEQDVKIDLEPKEKYVPKAHTEATAIFVSHNDESPKQSLERYGAIERKLNERERSLALLEKELASTSYRIKNSGNHEEEFDLQEQLGIKKAAVRRLKDEVKTIRQSLSELHSKPQEYAKREETDNTHSIKREEMLGLIHDAVTAEHKVEEVSLAVHPSIPIASEKKSEKTSEYHNKEQYNPEDEQPRIDSEIRQMQKNDNIAFQQKNTGVPPVIEANETETHLKEKSISEIHNDEVFFCRNGAVLKSLTQLYRATAEMDAESFGHHVNRSKNDFAVWIEHALALPELSNEIRKTKTKNGLKKAIEKWFIKLGIEESIGIQRKIVEKPQPKMEEARPLPKMKVQTSSKPLPKKPLPKPKPRTPDEILEDIHQHIQDDDFDNALKMLGSLKRHMSTRKGKNDIDSKMTEYEIKALETDIKILKLKHS